MTYKITAQTSHRCDKHLTFYSTGEACSACLEELKQALSKQFDAPVQSARHNTGKTQTRELDPAFILGMGEVLTKSRAKYDHFNWCKPTKLSTPYESAMRHLMAFQAGEDIDQETGLSHLLHVATNIMFMHYHITNNPEESDDRFFKKDKK